MRCSFAGFFDHFDSERVQVLGNVENAYIETIDEETKKKDIR